MSGFEFAASLVASLAWPVTVVALALVFRKALLGLMSGLFKRMGMMTELKAGNLVALKFSESVEQLDEQITEDARELVIEQTEPDLADEDTARLSPRTLVIESWIYLEDVIYWALYGEEPPTGVRRPPVRVAVSNSALPLDLKKQIFDLHRLRNAAVHESGLEISEQTAREYSRAAAKLAAIIRHPSRLGLLRDHTKAQDRSDSTDSADSTDSK